MTPPARYNRYLWCSSVAVLVTACGGGGGRDGNGSTRNPTLASGEPTIHLTAENAQFAGFLAFTSTELINGYGAYTAANIIDLFLDGRALDVVSCEQTGSVRTSLVENGDSMLGPGDVASIQVDDCNGTNGELTMSVASFVEQPAQLQASITFDVRYGLEATVTGRLNLAVAPNPGGLTWTSTNGSVRFDVGGFIEEVSGITLEHTFANESYQLDFTGSADSGFLGGRFRFDTSSPFEGVVGQFPTGGAVLVMGLRSQLTFAADSSVGDLLRLDIDANGDGDPESSEYYSWAAVMTGELFGIFESIDPVEPVNQPPLISQISFTPPDPRAGEALTVEAEVSDPEGDELTVSYVWFRNGARVTGVTGTNYPSNSHIEGDVITVQIEVSDGENNVSNAADVIIGTAPMRLLGVNAPTDVNYGSPVNYSVIVGDPDGSPVLNPPPVEYELDFGPAGMTVDRTTGAISWTPSGPLFEKRSEVRWGVRSNNRDVARVSGTIALTDDDRRYPLSRSSNFGPSVATGLIVSDLDSDGTQEILVLSEFALYELEWNGLVYEQSWEYPFVVSPGQVMRALAAGDTDADGRDEIFVCTDTELVRLDGLDREIAATTSVATDGRCESIVYGDFDADGNSEIAGIERRSDGPGRLFVLDALSLALEWSAPMMISSGVLAAGNVDADPSLELVTGNGAIFDGSTRAVQSTLSVADIQQLAIGDIDDDGVGEIVVGDALQALRAFEGDTGFELAALVRSDNDAIVVLDVLGDTRAEILLGDGQFGDLTIFELNAGSGSFDPVTAIESPGHGVRAIAAGDVDGDGDREVVWGPGQLGDNATLVVAGFTPTLDIEWSNENPGAHSSISGGALVRDGLAPPVLGFVSGYKIGFAGVRALTLDPTDGSLSFGDPLPTRSIGGVDTFDFDDDGADEFFAGTGDGFMYHEFFGTGESVQIGPLDLGAGIYLRHLDVTGDGRPELIGMTNSSSTGGRPPGLYIFDIGTQTILWEWPLPSFQANGLEVIDLDGDGTEELVIASNEFLVVLGRDPGGLSYSQAASREFERSIADIAAGDVDGDGTPEIFAVVRFSDIVTLDRSLNVRAVNPAPVLEENTDVLSLQIEALPFARKNLVIVTNHVGGRSYSNITVIDPDTAELVYRSPAHDILIRQALNYVDPAGDGHIAISYSNGQKVLVTR